VRGLGHGSEKPRTSVRASLVVGTLPSGIKVFDAFLRTQSAVSRPSSNNQYAGSAVHQPSPPGLDGGLGSPEPGHEPPGRGHQGGVPMAGDAARRHGGRLEEPVLSGQRRRCLHQVQGP